MSLRPIREEEKALIAHLLNFLKGGKRYKIPEEVKNLDNAGMGGLQLSSNGDHAEDLVEADYKDADGRDVLITLTANEHDELFELDMWKVDFSELKRYPVPEMVKLAE